jgi:nicotinamidase-related amidase
VPLPKVSTFKPTILSLRVNIDAFAGTHLDFVLRSHGITSIALAGQLTNICIESTMRAAYDKGYRVIGITDASATAARQESSSPQKR